MELWFGVGGQSAERTWMQTTQTRGNENTRDENTVKHKSPHSSSGFLSRCLLCHLLLPKRIPIENPCSEAELLSLSQTIRSGQHSPSMKLLPVIALPISIFLTCPPVPNTTLDLSCCLFFTRYLKGSFTKSQRSSNKELDVNHTATQHRQVNYAIMAYFSLPNFYLRLTKINLESRTAVYLPPTS